MNSDYYLVPIDMSNLLFKGSLFENTDSKGRFTRYVSNVVLNVNMFLFVRSIATPFSFELISENVSKILVSSEFRLLLGTCRYVKFTF